MRYVSVYGGLERRQSERSLHKYQQQLVAAADLCEGIALIAFEPAATLATDLRDYARRDNIARRGSTEDDQAAEAEQTPNG